MSTEKRTTEDLQEQSLVGSAAEPEKSAAEPEKSAAEPEKLDNAASLRPGSFLLGVGIAIAAVLAWQGIGTQSSESQLSDEQLLKQEMQESIAAEKARRPAEVSPARQELLGGEVKEVLQVTSYTYLRLKGSQGEFWAAVPKATPSIGAEVALVMPQKMVKFPSKELGRTFEEIYFATLRKGPEGASDAGTQEPRNASERQAVSSDQGGAKLAGTPSTPNSAQPSSALPNSALPSSSTQAHGVQPRTAVKPSQPLENGLTIEKLYAQKEDLQGKRVRLRATVTKITSQVMNTNFMHLQDGSGDDRQGTHDVIMKIADPLPEVGEEVIFSAVVQVNADLGYGYRYDLLLEEGRIE
ncbi:MAG: hypothetical protein MK135_00420 [Polyangiaceae bacterium]|nr:hypothetical protein [Polyangiaceae bacterium]